MTDFASPITDRRTDVTRFFSRPGVLLPETELPLPGFFTGGDLVDGPERNAAISGSGIVPVAGFTDNQSNKIGCILDSTYTTAWKDKLHVIETVYDAGIVLTPKQNSVEIGSGYSYVRKGALNGIFTVTDVGIVNDANIKFISGNEATPYVIGLGKGESYTYEIDSKGSGTINAFIGWAVTDIGVLAHYITGIRVDLFLFEPQLPIREAFVWFTSVIKSVNNTEKRQALRSVPAQQAGFNYLYGDELTNSKIENILRNYDKALTPKSIPWWLDKSLVSSTATAGDFQINVQSTDNRDFRIGGPQGLGLLLNPDTGAVEVFTITSYTSTVINTLTALLNTWPAGTEVYPLRSSVLKDNPGQVLWNINAREFSLVFDMPQAEDNGDETGIPTWGGTPIFTEPLTHDGLEYQRRWRWNIVRTGGNTSIKNSVTLFEAPMITSTFKVFWDSRSEYWAWRRWFHARRGKQKNFFLPTLRKDFEVQQDEIALGDILKYKINGYKALFDIGKYTRIRVLYTDGAIDYRNITNVNVVGSLYEEMTVDSDFSKIITADVVDMISFMIRYRLDSDTVEFLHETPEEGMASMPITELNE